MSKMRKLFIGLLFLCSFIGAYAQTAIIKSQLEDIPNEKIYVHSSSTMLLTGEYLYYSIYCLNAKTNRPSEISKTAYVELISSEGDKVSSEVVELKNGMGKADYFIQTSVGSGNYKLIAYTNWMKNNNSRKIFEQDILIINPYTSVQKNIIKDSIKKTHVNTISTVETSNVKLNKKTYSIREKVVLNLEDYGLDLGNYSVSVKKIETIPSPAIITTDSFINST